MLTLRQEAIKIVNEIPSDCLSEIVTYLRSVKLKKEQEPAPKYEKSDITEEEFQRFLHSGSGINPKKAAAFARLQKLVESNNVHMPANTDWKKEYEEALDEKYAEYIAVD